MAPTTKRTLAAIPAPPPPRATLLQFALAEAAKADQLAGDFLTRKELRAYANIRLRQAALLEADLNQAKAA